MFWFTGGGMAYFLQLVFAGIAVGCIYALIGLGFSIIFKASGVINFAQGELLLVGAYIVSAGVFEWHLGSLVGPVAGFFLALLLGIVVTVAIGLLFQRFVLQRMIGRPVFSILMVTIGLDIILRTIAIVTIGGVFLGAGFVAIDPTLGGTALLAFPAIILGGIDSVSGAVVGGIIIGLAQELTAGYESYVANFLGAGIHEITPYLIMILVLLIRPYGLFGTRKVERL